MIFISQGESPITAHQLQKKTQRIINRDWPEWKRERSIRLGDGEFNTYMAQIETDTDTNRTTNEFNIALQAYTQATQRLAQYQLALGRSEVREMQPTGEQVFNEETGEMDDVLHEVIVQTAIDPVEPTVEITEYDEEGNATVSTIENPVITQDNLERTEAQAVIDSTPQDVKTFANQE